MSRKFIADGLKLYAKHKDKSTVTKIIVQYATKQYSNLGTRSSSLSKLKKAIIQAHHNEGPVPDEVKAIKLSQKQYDTLFAATQKRLEIKSDECIDIPNADEFIDKVLSGLLGNTVAELFPAVALACGRRTKEILETGLLTPVKSNMYAALFTGQCKVREDPEPFEIPLLAPLPLVNNALVNLRAITNDKPQSASQLGNAVKIATGRDDLTPHLLRAIYAMILWKDYQDKGKGKKSMNRFISQVLGHSSMSTSVHYTRVKVSGLTTNKWKPTITLDMFETNGKAAENRCVENIISLYNEGKRITVNALRKRRSSPATIRAVASKNPNLMGVLKKI